MPEKAPYPVKELTGSGQALVVAYVSADGFAARGGIGRSGSYLRRALDESALGIRLIEQKTRFSEAPILKHLTAPLALAQFALRCASRRIDIAHINVAPRGSTWRKMLFAGMARFLGIPFVVHLHGSGYDGFYEALPSFRQRLIRRFFGNAAQVVALSDYWREVLCRDIGISRDRITVIPNGVIERPAQDRRDRTTCTIAFLGIIGERKGVDLLIEALALLPPDCPPWQAFFAGNGEVEWARDLAARRGLGDDRITFPGWLDEAQAQTLLERADLFVLPSRAENQPVSILEAMAQSLPVIASDVGAIPTQIEEGVTGRVVPCGDVAALAAALDALVRSPEERRSMGAAGLERIRARYSIGASARLFAALYRSTGEKA